MRAFVGLEPPLSIRRAISATLAQSSSAPEAAWVGVDHLHVTLRFLGDVPAEAGDFEALRQECARAAPCPVRFGPALQRLGHSALVVPVSGTDDLAGVTRATVAKADGVSEPATYFGHLTVALPRTPADVAWAQQMGGAPLRGGWTADAVCVFASETVAGARRYRVLARLPLAGRAPAGAG